MKNQDQPIKKTVSSEDIIRARRTLWYDGNLTWKLHDTQKEIHDFIKDSPNKIVVVNCSRRLGKSYLLLSIAIEQCLKFPGSQVKFLSPQVKMIRKILKPLMFEILKDCPREIRPKFLTQEGVWRFPNRSEIQLAGTEGGHAENLRGGSGHLCIIDEAGFCSDLDYIIKQILIPTTTTTGGKVVLLSTPPRNLDHEYNTFVKQAKFQNAFVQKTIYDNPLLSKKQIQEILDSLGGENSIEFRREYLCEMRVREEDVVIPEFANSPKDHIFDWPRPAFYDAYAAMDLGFKDLTVVLFAYLDFKNAKVVIEDEFVINGPKMTTSYLAENIISKEASLWRNLITKEVPKIYKRVSDTNLMTINDLFKLHNIFFIPTEKHDKDFVINHLRMLFQQKKIIINPRCTNLIRHLENATWAKNKKTFDRSPDNGHYDAVDSLLYLIRNIDWYKNPYPANYDLLKGGDIWENPYKKPEETVHGKFFKDMFTPKKIGFRPKGN